MSDEYRSPWDVLQLDYEATEKEVRRAYAVRLKQIDPAVDPKAFEVLRRAYEAALQTARHHGRVIPDQTAETVVTVQGASVNEKPAVSVAVATTPENGANLTATFQEMINLAHARNYSVERWLPLLNDPLLDDPWVSARFEYALVQELSENELKTDYTISAGQEWRALIESRYAWISDGLRYARMFPGNPDLREVLVEKERGKAVRYVPSFKQQAAERWPWAIAFVALLIFKACFEIWNRSPH